MTSKNDLTPVARKSSTSDVNSAILDELKKQTEYMHRMDWKLWVIMSMIKLIGEENGYTFESYDEETVAKDFTDEEKTK